VVVATRLFFFFLTSRLPRGSKRNPFRCNVTTDAFLCNTFRRAFFIVVIILNGG
jgi:hypothetical protein